MESEEFEIYDSEYWTDDEWWIDQDKRELIENPGTYTINKGEASGTIIGGNIGTLRLLQGTEYFPSLENSILFIEDDSETLAHHFDRDLQSLIHLDEFSGVKGIVIGRFQKQSKISQEILRKIMESKPELADLPIIANANFGHTDPKFTFPIGGEAEIKAGESHEETTIRITSH
jgi:muramoyltetrapeptide carboxypeptidase LdcA involved in peptidoglycan recycling